MADNRGFSNNLVRMWKCYRTLKEMCIDRGYEVLEEDAQISLADFAAQYGLENGEIDRQRLNFSCNPSVEMIKKYEEPPRKDGSIPEPMCGRLWVEFNSDENVGMKQIRQFMHHLVAEQFFSGILVCVKPLTGMGIKALRGMQAMEEGPRGGCEVFVEQDLLINVTKHELVPKHVVLSREEKAQLLLKYRLKETQLPRIQVTDPVAKYLGLRRGQVVKIIRKSETAGRYATYRWAI